MAEITATMVKELREKTQAGMMDCKKALKETNGDMDAAVKLLREKGLSAAAKRVDRIAAQGIINIKPSADGKKTAMVELNAETDFVARNDNFKKLLINLTEQVLTKNPKNIDDLSAQSFYKDESRKVADIITETIAVIGENIVARRFALYEAHENEIIADYTHLNGSIGVLVKFQGLQDIALAKDIAMHVAAANPTYLKREEIPANVLESEKSVYKQQALNEGKPAAILDKIAEGKLNKFYKENCLVEQEFVKDPDKTIKQLLPAGVDIISFERFQLGA